MTRPLRIQPRDLALIRDVYLHRFARRDDLISLGHFRSVPRCNYRLGQLVQANWLRRIESVNGLALRQMLYGVGRAAYRYLAESLDVSRDEVLRTCATYNGPQIIEHSLRVLDFRTRLITQASICGYQLTEWRCEPECLHEFEHRRSASSLWLNVVMKPDGFCTIRDGHGKTRHYFIEIDLGHVSLPRFQSKLWRYVAYCSSGAFREAYGLDTFSVLTVTTGELRLRHLTSLKTGPVEHFATTWNRFESCVLADCLWHSRHGHRHLFHPGGNR